MNRIEVELFLSGEPVLAWSRYLCWAEMLYARFARFAKGDPDMKNVKNTWRAFALFSQWLASLYVLVEGWEHLGVTDAGLDKLLSGQAAPGYRDLLRRYRNAVFHYKPRLAEVRFAEFVREGPEVALWAMRLHRQFVRFLWEWLELQDMRLGWSRGAKDTRRAVRSLIGWVPPDRPRARTPFRRVLRARVALDHVTKALELAGYAWADGKPLPPQELGKSRPNQGMHGAAQKKRAAGDAPSR